jgi:hypothetical protein
MAVVCAYKLHPSCVIAIPVAHELRVGKTLLFRLPSKVFVQVVLFQTLKKTNVNIVDAVLTTR